MKTLINQAQAAIDNINIKKYVSYEASIYPILLPIITKLKETKEFPKITNINQGFDAYIESLMLILFHEYSNELSENIFNYVLIRDSILPLYCIVYVLIKHPIFLNIISSNLTLAEWKEWRTKILDEIISIFGDTQSHAGINELRTKLSTNIDTTSMSSLHTFRYLIGFSFSEETTGIRTSFRCEYINDKSLVQYQKYKINSNLSTNT